MPPVVLALATVTGAIVTARFLKKEWQRVNNELDRAETVRAFVRSQIRRLLA